MRASRAAAQAPGWRRAARAARRQARNTVARSRAAVWHPCTTDQGAPDAAACADCARRRRMAVRFRGKRYLDAAQSAVVVVGQGDLRISAGGDTVNSSRLPGFTHRPVIDSSERRACSPPAWATRFTVGTARSRSQSRSKMSFHYRRRGQVAQRSLRAWRRPSCQLLRAVDDVAIFRDTHALAAELQHRRTRPAPRASRRTPRPPRRAYLSQHHATTAALIVEPLVQGALGHGHARRVLPALLRNRARASACT